MVGGRGEERERELSVAWRIIDSLGRVRYVYFYFSEDTAI